MERISICFNEDCPVLGEINTISNELGVARSYIIRDILGEAFGIEANTKFALRKKHLKNA